MCRASQPSVLRLHLGWCSTGAARSNSHPSWPHQLERSIRIPSFSDLGVGAALARRLEALGIASPLAIQTATIPEALAGRDICGTAPTGSGKTLAFSLPLVAATTGPSSGAPRALVLVPTRELAEQVRTVLASLSERPDRVVSVYGGTSYGPQRHALRKGVDIVIACPGRLEDLIARGDVRLDKVDMVVLDEADRMVDMGFLQPVRRIVDQTAEDRQVLLFSATIGPEVESVIRQYQRNPLRHEVAPEPAGAVTHLFWRAPRPERVQISARLIAEHGQAFVFCRTKRSADRVARQLQAEGVDAAPMHGDRTQIQRSRALASFAAGRTQALVATDVVARGIHVDDVPCVVHFDPPSDATSYVHRSGRTGRAGRTGTVVSLVPEEARADVRSLQRSLGMRGELTAPFDGRLSQRAVRPAAPLRTNPSVEPRSPGGTADGSMTGTVKFYDTSRGFGFLAAPDGSEIFVHHSKLQSQGAGRASLRKGDRVSFDLAVGRRGHEARNVTAARQGAA